MATKKTSAKKPAVKDLAAKKATKGGFTLIELLAKKQRPQDGQAFGTYDPVEH